MGAALRMIAGESAATSDGFDKARGKFEEVVTLLRSPKTMSKNHREVEDALFTEGMALLRDMFQAHVDARGPGTVADDAVEGADGVVRTHVRGGQGRDLETRFGTVVVDRTGYGQRGTTSVYPLDAELNLPTDLFSHGVRRMVAAEASKGAFDNVVKSLTQYTGAKVAKRQAEELAVRAAQDFDRYYLARHEDAEGAQERTGPLLVITSDGRGVRVYPGDLRDPKPRKAHKRGLMERLEPGEKPGLKRMATVAAVYTINRFVREPLDIVGEMQDHTRPKRPLPEHKRIWASLKKDPEDVLEEAFAEAQFRDPRHRKQWVALVDGDRHQLANVRKLARRYRVKVTIVLDIYHVSEYLWKAAHALNPDDSNERKRWVGERLHAVLAGNGGQVAAGMRRSATMRKLGADKRKAVDACAQYLHNNAGIIQYDAYLTAGLPIATGVIEGAGRHLIDDRMDIAGARWHLDTADAVLQLRALQAADDFTDYWTFHESLEAQRNHTSKYANDSPPKTTRAPHLKVVK